METEKERGDVLVSDTRILIPGRGEQTFRVCARAHSLKRVPDIRILIPGLCFPDQAMETHKDSADVPTP